MDMKSLMEQAKKMQAQMDKAKAVLEAKEFNVEKQGIKVVVLGSRKIKSIDINEMLIDPEDKDIIEGLIIVAINEAMDQIKVEEEALVPKQQGMF